MVTRGRNVIFGTTAERSFRPGGRSEWSSVEPSCRDYRQVDLFDVADDAAFEDDQEDARSAPPRGRRTPVPGTNVRSEQARPTRSELGRRPVTLHGAGWGEVSLDAHRALGIQRYRGPELPARDDEVDHATLIERGYAVSFDFFEDHAFEFGVLAEGVSIGVDMRWITVSNEPRVLKRCAHAMLSVARELAARGYSRGARALLKNHSTGEVFLWKFFDGMWSRTEWPSR